MDTGATHMTGWKPLPLVLKILAVVVALWSLGSVANLANLMENGLPLLGVFVDGISAALVVLLLDIIGPLVLLYAFWQRKPWAPGWAMLYIGLFILNAVVAFFTVREQLGLAQILVPTLVNAGILLTVLWKRDYFARAG